MKSRSLIAGLAGAGLVAGLVFAFSAHEVIAADHGEAPLAAADPTADILDFFAWHKDDGKVVAIITYNGFIPAGGNPVYDPDVVYAIHIDNDMDNVADHTAWIRVAANATDQWYARFEGMPGVADPVVGPVNTPVDIGPGSEQAWVGLADDPFFFDLDGYLATLDTATVSFDSSNDNFAGENVMAIVVELSEDAVGGGGTNIQLWASTYR